MKIKCRKLTKDVILLSFFFNLGCVTFPCFANEYHADRIEQNLEKIAGKVTDVKGEPIPGVTIRVDGTTRGVVTDADGLFTIEGSKGQTLIVSFIGYGTQNIKIVGLKPLNIVLEESINQLDELVVVSYGTQKKRDLTGSVTKVDSNGLSDFPVGQFAQKLQGQVPGVQITQSTGQPGKGMNFRIRGAASINSGNQPLFVVDGLPVDMDLSNINPDEIESFSILKDAAASSLYGSRAANGVVLITTKKGKKGRTQVDLNVSYGIQTMRGLNGFDMMNGEEFAQFKKEYYEDQAKYEGYTGGVPEHYQNPSKYGKGYNWFDELTHDTSVQNYSLSVSANKGNLTSAIVLGYFHQDGIVRNTDYERFSVRANNDYQVNDRLKIGLNLAPTLQINHNVNTDGGWQILNSILVADPTVGPYDENGELRYILSSPGTFPSPNWINVINEKLSDMRTFSLLGNVFAELDIWKGIKYKFQAGLDWGTSRYRAFNPSIIGGAAGGAAPPQPATGEYGTNFRYNWTIENMLMYNNKFGDHSVDLLVGYTAQKSNSENGNLKGTDFPDDKISWLNVAATKTGTSYMEEYALLSLIGRANYSYKDRYLLQATIRRDGCSRFGSGQRWANFPSVSVGWIASDEAFMQPVSNVMNYLKFRASYGTTGNYNIGNYTHIAPVEVSNYVFGGVLAPGKAITGLGNNNLTWEENKQFDFGVDIGFLGDRIFVVYDYYKKKVDAMLYQIDIPLASGFGNVQSNIGGFESWGHEISVQSRNLIGDFKWSTNMNVSFNRNKVTELGTNNTPIGGYANIGDYNRLEVGEPVGIFMGYVFDGVYMTQEEFDSQPKHASSEIGTVRMKDLDDNKVIDANDRTKIGDPNPDFIYGITNEFSYKNFDLSILLSGQVGGDVLNSNYEQTLNLDGCFNVDKSVIHRWRSPENPGNGLIPRTKSGTTELFRYNNSSWVFDASYLCIKNITLGYTVPIKPNRYLSKLRVYFTAQQLATFSKYPGMNPEVSTNGLGWSGLGIDATTYPIPRTFSIGCNISF